jgi:hypothetical protein
LHALKCSCGARWCAGSYPNPEFEEAMQETLAHVAPLLAGHAADTRLHTAIIAARAVGHNHLAFTIPQ